MEREYWWPGERSRLDASVRGCSSFIAIDDNAARLHLAPVIPMFQVCVYGHGLNISKIGFPGLAEQRQFRAMIRKAVHLPVIQFIRLNRLRRLKVTYRARPETSIGGHVPVL